MNADLIGFLLNADDAAEHAELERAVARDPQLAAQVVRLRQSLEPLELLRDTGPVPAGLAKRTVERIMGQPVVRRVAASALPSNDAAPTGSRWLRTRWDAAIACSIVLVMSGLGLQGVSRLHHAYERTACQNNLRSMYNSLETYASANNGALPVGWARGRLHGCPARRQRSGDRLPGRPRRRRTSVKN